MKLYERLPDRIKVGRRTFKVNLDFRNVLQFMEILARDDLLPGARDYLALKTIMRRPPKMAREAVEAVKVILFPGTKKTAENAKLTDFEQDANLIRAAFRQVYGIDLYRDNVHWLEFSALLNALPEGSKYTEVLGIRARPVPAPTKYNQKEREWLIKAKAELALNKSEEEIEDAYSRGVIGVFNGLLSIAKGAEHG